MFNTRQSSAWNETCRRVGVFCSKNLFQLAFGTLQMKRSPAGSAPKKVKKRSRAASRKCGMWLYLTFSPHSIAQPSLKSQLKFEVLFLTTLHFPLKVWKAPWLKCPSSSSSLIWRQRVTHTLFALHRTDRVDKWDKSTAVLAPAHFSSYSPLLQPKSASTLGFFCSVASWRCFKVQTCHLLRSAPFISSCLGCSALSLFTVLSILHVYVMKPFITFNKHWGIKSSIFSLFTDESQSSSSPSPFLKHRYTPRQGLRG